MNSGHSRVSKCRGLVGRPLVRHMTAVTLLGSSACAFTTPLAAETIPRGREGLLLASWLHLRDTRERCVLFVRVRLGVNIVSAVHAHAPMPVLCACVCGNECV